MTSWIARIRERFSSRSAVAASAGEPETRAATDAGPSDHDFGRGVKLFEAGRYDEAAACLEAAVERVHDLADAHYYLGLIRHKQGRLEEACDAFVMALCFAPEMARAHTALAYAERKRGKPAAALQSIERAIEAGERTAEAHKLRGALLFESGNIAEAIASFEAAIASSPDDAESHSNLGYLLFNHRAEYERGTWHLERALEIDPDDAHVLCNYTIVLLSHRGDLEGTVQLCDRLLSAQPDLHEARLNRAIARLKMGRFDLAWDDYEARKHVPAYAIASPLPHPELQESGDLSNRTILIQSEQGLGDEIMFASCFEELSARGARCIILCSPRLVDLFRRSFPSATVAGTYSQLTESDRKRIDSRVAAGSLPRLFRRSLAEFPRHRGYLRPDPAMAAAWREKLGRLGPGLKIGLSWQGGTISTQRVLRSIPLHDLAPLLEVEHCHFVDLQYGETADERSRLERATGRALHHWREAIDDLDQCAALIAGLDLVISVCTTAIHLAGAVGCQVWVMVPRNPEWRYGTSGEEMPWYPGATLIRQRSAGDWHAVIAEVAQRLRSHAITAMGRSERVPGVT